MAGKGAGRYRSRQQGFCHFYRFSWALAV